MRPQALVTGGSRGIGKAICEELVARGYDIAFTYRTNEDSARAFKAELSSKGAKVEAYQLDLGDTSQIETVVEKIQTDFPQIETLISNAGMTIDGITMRFKLEDFEKIINTNLKGAFFITQLFLRPMMKAKKGSIVFISSVAGQMGNAGQAAYSTTKAGLLGLTKSLAKEVGSRNVRVNAVTPGFIKTDMTSALPEQYKQSIVSQIPLGCFGEPEDIAKIVAFLASSDSKYVTGQVLSVNGGLYM